MRTGTKHRLSLLACLMILCLLPFGAFANAETGLGLAPPTQQGTITDSCTIMLPEALADKSHRITDSLVETYLILPAGSEITVQLPEAAQAVYLQWYAQPAEYTFEQFDASGAPISFDEPQSFYNCCFPVTENTRSVKLTLGSEMSLSGLFVYAAAAELPGSVQQWQKTSGKTDIMIVAATPETALTEFGAVLARYSVEHAVPTSVIILSDGTRTSVEEFLSALWHMGVTQQPVFADFHCDNNAIYKTVNAQWKKRTVSRYLADAIANFTPSVIVTHPASEEAGLAAAQFTGEQAIAAVKKAKTGKVYNADAHGATALPDDALITAGGRTISEAVRDAYAACCTSQQQFKPDITPNLSFALASTQLGDDASGTDLLENIDVAGIAGYVDPTPTPSPTPEPTPSPTDTPAVEPTVAPMDTAPTETKTKITVPLSVLTKILPAMGAGIVLTILSFLLLHDRIYRKYRRKRRRRKGKRIARLVGFAPLMLAVAVSLVFLLLGLEKQDVKISVPAAEPAVTEPAVEEPPADQIVPDDAAAEPDAEAAVPEEAADAESASSERTPTDADKYFRTEDEAAEVFSADYENGKWAYKSDALSIEIDRRSTTNAKGPVVYFVAHIRMRDVNTFRTTLSDADNKGDGLQKPWIVARREKAVLLITGDNLVHMDTEFKSILIRRGRVYQDKPGFPTDTLAMLPDLSMRSYVRHETSASELLQDGVRDAFSFGPTLMRNGEVQTDLDTGRLRIINPRTGVGMIEPGHFVAIVVDGRQADYSVGMLLSEFAELFKAEGCTLAYNLDGGVSTCMIFMGEQVNHHGVRKKNNNQDDTYQRRIPDALIWGYSEQVPGEDDPITYTGELTR